MKKSLFIQRSAIVCLLAVCFHPVFANSALTFWQGTEGSETISTNEDCPVEVEHETLTFLIHDQPRPGMVIDNDSHPYGNSFRAEYTFHNPSDMHVKALLSFPFGMSPGYVAKGQFDDNSLYSVEINGEPIDAVIRCTMKQPGTSFSLKEDLVQLSDTYITDSFFTPDLEVTEYRLCFHIDESGLLENQAVNADTSLPRIPAQQKILIDSPLASLHNDETSCGISLGVHDGSVFSLFVFGKELDQLPEWHIYTDTATEQTEITGEAELIEENRMTYEEFVLMSDRTSIPEGMIDIDYYNAVTSALHSRYAEATLIEWGNFITDGMMKWLQYELEFEPGETIINTVSAPCFPDIHTNYEPALYVYHYLLSPASSWKKFGSLDIVLETDQYIHESSMYQFEKTANGYQAHFEELPEGELSFSLSASEDPKRDINPVYWIFSILVIAVPLIALILLITLVITVIKLIRKRREEE